MASSYYNLENFIYAIESWGLTDVLLPFLLIFTVLFAILQKTSILGDKKKNMNVVVAVIIGLIVVIPHVLGRYENPDLDPVNIINRALPSVSLLVIAVMCLLILIGIFGGDVKYFGLAFSGWIAWLSILAIAIIFISSARGGRFWLWFNQFFGSDAVALIVILLVFGLIVAFIMGGEKEASEKAAPSKFKEALDDIFRPR